MPERLDKRLSEQLGSRTRAKDAIDAGRVLVNGKKASKPSVPVSDEDVIDVLPAEHDYVSRAGGKLEAAIDEWNIDLEGQTAADIGASTGGFTQCVLEHGAEKVYAIDVGHLQLHPSLKADQRVVEMEGRNAREIEPGWFAEPIDFVCMDVSFISCRPILQALFERIHPKHMVLLVKPQFELGPDALNKSGVVKNPKKGEEAADAVKREIRREYSFVRMIPSPVKGRNGNQEYVIYAKDPVQNERNQ